MRNKTVRELFGWGFLLWLLGYVLGILLFAVVPVKLIGWVITPIGVTITLSVLFKKIYGNSVGYYALIGVVWTCIAVVCDYLFLVLAFKPDDGYYKLDVYLYYALTLLLPILVGSWKLRASSGHTPSSTPAEPPSGL